MNGPQIILQMFWEPILEVQSKRRWEKADYTPHKSEGDESAQSRLMREGT